MLEQEIERIITHLVDRSIGAKQGYTLLEALAADIPPGVKTYLRAEVRKHLTLDIKSSLHLARVNMNTPEVRLSLHGFLEASSTEYLFPQQEFIASLDNAVHFLTNYLCRPQWTLTEFVFSNSKTVARDIVLSKLEYLIDYPYYKNLVRGILERKGWKEISEEQFRSVLSSIDRHYMRQHTVKELAGLSRPMFQFLTLADSPSTGRIPIKPVLVFFADKSEHTLKEYIENTCRVRNSASISFEELSEILADAPSAGLTLNDVAEAPGSEEQLEIDQIQATPAADETQPSPAASANVPASILVADNLQKSPAADAEESRLSIHKGNKNLALSLTFAGLVDKSPSGALPGLGKLISSELRDLFIRELFSNDEAYYNVIIETLDRALNWNAASLYLTRFCEINGIDQNAEEFSQFTGIVRQRYSTDPSGDA